jgi:hypothetical protein
MGEKRARSISGIALLALLLILMAAPIAAADRSVSVQQPQLQDEGGSFSGDDAYDPAAGGSALPGGRQVNSFSGDDAYDPAAGGMLLPASSYVSSFSGDDAYDPAAGGVALPASSYADSYSGDDAYDAAAGGLAQPAAIRPVASAQK